MDGTSTEPPVRGWLFAAYCKAVDLHTDGAKDETYDVTGALAKVLERCKKFGFGEDTQSTLEDNWRMALLDSPALKPEAGLKEVALLLEKHNVIKAMAVKQGLHRIRVIIKNSQALQTVLKALRLIAGKTGSAEYARSVMLVSTLEDYLRKEGAAQTLDENESSWDELVDVIHMGMGDTASRASAHGGKAKGDSRSGVSVSEVRRVEVGAAADRPAHGDLVRVRG